MLPGIDTVFHPNAGFDSKPTDLVLASSDNIQFYVHRDRVVTSSTNCFALLLLFPADGPVVLAEDFSLVSLILHLIYNIPLRSPPDASTVPKALGAFRKYGLPARQYFGTQTQLLEATRAHLVVGATDYALDLYTLASRDDLMDLAKAASSRLLSLYLPMVDVAKMSQIDAVYLNMLYTLFAERLQTFHTILSAPPPSHPEMGTCGDEERSRFSTDWTLQVSDLALAYPTPDAPPDVIRTKLSQLEGALDCESCKAALRAQVDRIVSEWEDTKDTI